MRARALAEHEIEPSRRPGDTAEIRVTLDAERGSERLEQRVIRFSPGRSQPQALDGVQGILYVVSGTGTLHVGGSEHELEPESGVYLVAGESFEIDNPGPDELVTVLVTSKQPNGTTPNPDPRVVR